MQLFQNDYLKTSVTSFFHNTHSQEKHLYNTEIYLFFMSKDVKDKILARVLVEVLGAPKEHIEKAIMMLVDKMQEQRDIKILSEETAEAAPRGKLFSTFSELDIEFKDLVSLEKFMFDFTPSSIEIIEPENLVLSKGFFSGVLNDFMLKLHETALEYKDMTAQSQVLAKNTDAIIRNFLLFALKEKRSSDDISKITGIPAENIGAILEKFESAGVVKKEGDLWIKS